MDPIQARTLCKARRRNGEPCGNPPMLGSTVCRMHGGSAPQVKQAAQVRLMMAADPAAARLIEIANDKTMPPNVRLAANKEILDRANVVGTQQLNVEVSAFEERTRKIVVRWEDFADDEGNDTNILDAEVVDDEPAAITAGDYDDEPEPPARNRFDRALDEDVDRQRKAQTYRQPAAPVQPPAPAHEFTPDYYDPSAGATQSEAEWRAGAMKRARSGDSNGLRPKRIRKR